MSVMGLFCAWVFFFYFFFLVMANGNFLDFHDFLLRISLSILRIGFVFSTVSYCDQYSYYVCRIFKNL